MLYHLLYPLHTDFAVFYVFRFITFRTIYAAITALVDSNLAEITDWPDDS